MLSVPVGAGTSGTSEDTGMGTMVAVTSTTSSSALLVVAIVVGTAGTVAEGDEAEEGGAAEEESCTTIVLVSWMVLVDVLVLVHFTVVVPSSDPGPFGTGVSLGTGDSIGTESSTIGSSTTGLSVPGAFVGYSPPAGGCTVVVFTSIFVVMDPTGQSGTVGGQLVIVYTWVTETVVGTPAPPPGNSGAFVVSVVGLGGCAGPVAVPVSVTGYTVVPTEVISVVTWPFSGQSGTSAAHDVIVRTFVV